MLLSMTSSEYIKAGGLKDTGDKYYSPVLLLSSVDIADVLLENILINWLFFLAGILLKIHYPFGGGRQGQEEGLSDSEA